MNNLEIRVLSLPDAYARRTKFQERFSLVSKLKFQFFDGVYGKNIPDEILKSIYDDKKAKLKINRSMTVGEIGATYSHYLIYKDAYEKKLDYLIVLEDDSFVDENFDDVINRLLVKITPDDDAIIFIQKHTLDSKVIFSRKKDILKNGFELVKMLGSSQYFVGSYGYILTKKSINKIIQNYLPIYCVCDHWFFIKKDSKIESFYCVSPSLVYTNDEDIRLVDSFINEERKNVLKNRVVSRIGRIKIIIKRVVLRLLNKDWE